MEKKEPNKSLVGSFSSLPEELVLNCLALTSKSQYRLLSLVSKHLCSLLSSPELYKIRSSLGKSEPCLYLCQDDRWFALDRTLITDGWIKNELSLLPIIPSSSSSAPTKSTIVAVGFEIYQIGGTISGNEPSSAVRVLDCRTHTWRDAPSMTVARKRARSAYFLDGKIFVYGGTKDTKNWAEVFDLKTHTWKPLPSPSPGPGPGPIPSPRTSIECVVDNVKLSVFWRAFMWYDSERVKWLMVKGLEDLKHVFFYSKSTIQLANYCGKLVIIWYKEGLFPFPARRYISKNKRIWCAVIRLEKRIGFSGLEIWGEIERSSAVLTVPDSYEILTCITL